MRFDGQCLRWGSVIFVALVCATGAMLPRWCLVGALAIATSMLVAAARRSAREDRAARQRTVQLRRLHGIIDRKVRERTMWLEDELEQYRAIVENLDAVAFEYDVRKQRFVYIAPQAAKLLECEPGEITAELVFACIHPGERAGVDALLRRGHHAEPFDCRIVTKRGRNVHTRTFISSRAGSRRMRGLVLDVTREKQLEHELRQASKLESVGRLAAGVAHELNTPIQYIADSVDFVREAIAELDGPDRDYLLTNIPLALERASNGVQTSHGSSGR